MDVWPAAIGWNADTPAILEHRPDLVIMGGYDGSAAVAARLREQGIAVIGLGQATGMMSYRQNRRRLARVFGQEATTELRIAREDIAIASIQSWVQQQVPADQLRVLYLSAYGTQLYGGAARTGYHDVIIFSGA